MLIQNTLAVIKFKILKELITSAEVMLVWMCNLEMIKETIVHAIKSSAW